MKKVLTILICAALVISAASFTVYAGSGSSAQKYGTAGTDTITAQIGALKVELKANHKNKAMRLNLVRQIIALRRQLNDKTIPVYVDGKEIKFDVPPVIKYGRTLIPVRAVMNSLGADVDWDSATKTVTVTKTVYTSETESETMTVIFDLMNKKVFVNSVETPIEFPAQLISNRTFVPLRFLAEILGKKVQWDKDSGAVIIDDEDEDQDEDATPSPGVSPTPSASPGPDATPSPGATPEPTPEPSPEASPEATPTPEPTPTPSS